MRKLILIGAGVAVLAGGGVALAQMPPGGPDGPMSQGRGSQGMGPEGQHERWQMMEHMRQRHREGGAAAFRFRKGDMEVGIRCSDREPTQVCVAAASALIDRLANTQPKAP